MKIKKTSLNLIIVILAVSVFSYLLIKISADASIKALADKNNEFCTNLTAELALIDKNCYCYFQNFGSDNPELDKHTDPLCACDCIENGTPVSIGILIPT